MNAREARELFPTITPDIAAARLKAARGVTNTVSEKIQRAALRTIRLNLLVVLAARAQAEHLFDAEARTKVLTGYEPAGPCRVFAVDLNPRESECAVCGVPLVGCRTGIPFFEGEPVPHDWHGDWVGRDACPKCFADYEAAQANDTIS